MQLHVGIFGPSLCGKTTLAKALAKSLYDNHNIESIVLDPNSDDWGKHTTVFTTESTFWRYVWSTKGKFVIVEESAETIKRDKKLIPLFTRLRHCGHKLCVIGHDGADLLPVMRRQLSTLYLFRQSADSAKIWYKDFPKKEIFECENLNVYEFLHCVAWGPITKRKLSL